MFEFVMQYNHRDFLYLNKLTARTYRKWYNLFYRLFTAVFGAFFTASGIFLLSGGGSIVSCIFIMVIGMTLLLVSAFTSRISAWRSKRLSVQNLGQITFTFTDEQISYVCAKESAQLPYSSILSFFRYHGICTVQRCCRHSGQRPLPSPGEGQDFGKSDWSPLK